MDILQKYLQDLEDKPLGQRYKIINQIHKEISNTSLSTQQQTTLLETFKAKDNIEKKLWVNLLSNFKIRALFIEKLKSEDHEFIEILLKGSKWFFVEPEHKLTGNDIIFNIFPYISYSIRIQFLYYISKYYNTGFIDELFILIRKEYNLKLALKVLTYCSSEFIIKVLMEDNLNVDDKLLLKIYKSNSACIINYLQLVDKEKLNGYGTIFKILAWQNPDVFFQFYHNNDALNLSHLGENCTKKLIATNKSYILGKPERYLNILHKRTLYYSLSLDDYKKFYLRLANTNREDEYVQNFNRKGMFYTLLCYMKDDIKVEFLFSVYRTLYDKDLLENKLLYTKALLDILPLSMKSHCAQINIDDRVSDWEQWYCYINPNEAYDKLKQLVYITNDANDRLKYIKYMIKNCGIYKDLVNLVQVLKYINERHRNEDSAFRNAILDSIKNNFDLKLFGIEIWTCIDEIVMLIHLADEWDVVAHSCYNILTERTRFNIKNNINIDEYLEYIIIVFKTIHKGHYNFLIDNTEYEKMCIEHTINILPNLMCFNIDNDAVNILNTICHFNLRHDDKLSIVNYEWVFNAIKSILNKNDTYLVSCIKDNINNDEEAKALLNITINDKITIFNVLKYIKSKPDVIIQSLHQILTESIMLYAKKIIFCIKKRKFIYIPGLKQIVLTFCLDKLKLSDVPKVKSNVVKVLCFLVDSKSFYDLMFSYFPEHKKVDVKNRDLEVYAMQQAIACCIGKYTNSPDTLKALLTFCRGDYLKLTLGSLNSVCLKLSQNNALSFLNTNIDQPVSAKKHYIRLINIISTKHNALTMLKEMWNKEANPSLRHVIITLVFNWFASDANDEIWMLLKNIFLGLTIQDKDIFNLLLSFNKVSDAYVEEHIKLCWSTSLHLENKEKVSLNQEKCIIMNRIINNIKLFDEKFLDELILFSFDKKHKHNLQNVFSKFTVHYILFTNNKNKFVYVKQVLQNYVNENWMQIDSKNPFVYIYRKVLFDFMQNLIILSVNNKALAFNFNECFNIILTIFKPQQIYKQYLNLELTLLYLQSKDTNDFINNIRTNFIDKQLNLYGTEILSYLSNSIRSFIKIVDKNMTEKYLMLIAQKLLHNNKCHKIVAISLLQKCFETKSMYDEFTKILSECDDVSIQILLNEHFNN